MQTKLWIKYDHHQLKWTWSACFLGFFTKMLCYYNVIIVVKSWKPLINASTHLSLSHTVVIVVKVCKTLLKVLHQGASSRSLWSCFVILSSKNKICMRYDVTVHQKYFQENQCIFIYFIIIIFEKKPNCCLFFSLDVYQMRASCMASSSSLLLPIAILFFCIKQALLSTLNIIMDKDDIWCESWKDAQHSRQGPAAGARWKKVILVFVSRHILLYSEK